MILDKVSYQYLFTLDKHLIVVTRCHSERRVTPLFSFVVALSFPLIPQTNKPVISKDSLHSFSVRSGRIVFDPGISIPDTIGQRN